MNIFFKKFQKLPEISENFSFWYFLDFHKFVYEYVFKFIKN